MTCALVLATSGTRALAKASDGYVGTAACAGCHAVEATAWRGSHHDLAMEEATPATVLGDFGDATFTYGSVTSRFFTRDGRYLVNTDGADGRLADFEIRYTFGIHPLQQYLIAFPDGRLQALGIAWDARPREQGGQRGRGEGGQASIAPHPPAGCPTPERRSTGPAATRPGTSPAPSATRPTCARTTTRRATATGRAGPRSTSPASPATGPAPPTSPGPGARRGRPARAWTTASPSTSASARASTGWRTRRRASRRAAG